MKLANITFNAAMLNLTPIFVGLRYTRSKRRQQFISFVSGFSLIGIALGVLALIVVLSVMNGFDREIKQRILSVIPHGFVDGQLTTQGLSQTMKTLEQVNGVVAAAPYISEFVMLSSTTQAYGVELQAILPAAESQVSDIENYFTDGSLNALQPGEFGIILGASTARYLRVRSGDSVTMTLPQVSVTPAGIFPRSKRFTVVGLFEVGANVDQTLALIHLNDGQRLFRMNNRVQGLRIQTDDIYTAEKVLQRAALILGDNFSSRDWTTTQGGLFQAIRMEKRMVTLLLMIIIAVAALNIVTSLVMMVTDKRGDIAVLRTMGMTTGQIMAVFIVQGSAIGLFGVFIGGFFGSFLAMNISDIVSWFERVLGLYVFDPNVYFITQLPSELQSDDVIMVCFVAIALSFLATLYPAWRASQVAPAEVLRYE